MSNKYQIMLSIDNNETLKNEVLFDIQRKIRKYYQYNIKLDTVRQDGLVYAVGTNYP